MGHSKRTRSVVSCSNYKGSGGSGATKQENLNEFIDKISEKDKEKIFEYTIKYVLPALPNGSSKIVIYYCLKYGIQLLKDSQEVGVEEATKKLAKTVITQHVVPMAINAAWDCVDDHIIQENANKGISRFGEEAFKETMSNIMTRGVDAL